jgi:hypothetical protein
MNSLKITKKPVTHSTCLLIQKIIRHLSQRHHLKGAHRIMIFGGDETTDHDAEFALHLGDYIYEYAANGYASSAAAGLGRVCLPANEWLTLADYRA